MADEEETAEARWVYIGRRLSTDQKLYHYYFPIREDGTPDAEESLCYDKRIDRNVSVMTPEPGAVYVVHTTKQGRSVMIGGEKAPKYDRMYEDEKLVAEWTLLETEALTRHKVNKRMREEMSEDRLGKSLRPVIQAMRKTNALGRAAIKVVVLDYLTRHGG